MLARGRTLLSEDEAKALIGAYGIPTVETAVAASPAEVEAPPAGIVARHGAVVVKILSDDLSPSDASAAARLGIASAQAFDAASEMLARVRWPQARARLHRAADGAAAALHELILGMSEDVTFGPCCCSAPGTAVEVLRDTSLALPPLDLKLAHDLMRRTRVPPARRLRGRGPTSTPSRSLSSKTSHSSPTCPRSASSTSTR